MWRPVQFLMIACIISASQADSSSAAGAVAIATADPSGSSASAVAVSSASNDSPSNDSPPPSGNPDDSSPPDNGDGGQGGDGSNSACPEALERYRQAVIAYTAKVANGTAPWAKDDFYIYSPVAVMDLLAYLARYAVGKTYDEILTLTNLKSRSEIKCVIPAELALFTNQPEGITYTYSAVIAADYRYNFTEEFKNDWNSLGLKALNTNFKNTGRAKKQISNLVASGTSGYVKNAARIIRKTGLNIVAGQYFAAPFDNPFNMNNISINNYYGLNDKMCNVSYLYQRGVYDYAYSDELQAELLSIPYVDNYFEALFIIPTETDGYLDVAQKLASNPGLFQTAYDSMSPTQCDIYLPKYGSQTKMVHSRTTTMQSSDVRSIFKKGSAQFKNLVVGDKPIADDVFSQKVIFKNIYDAPKSSDDCGCCDSDDDDDDDDDSDPDSEYSVVKADRVSLIYIIHAGFPLFLVYGNLPCVS